MNTRNHPLKVGEVVFDCDNMLFGIITELTPTKAVLEMNKDFAHNFDCLEENTTYFDCEIGEDEQKWETENLEELYQMAWDRAEWQDRFPVCYEHQPDIDYPFYCPYLDENLYRYETQEV
jgi:hypothetical protein